MDLFEYETLDLDTAELGSYPGDADYGDDDPMSQVGGGHCQEVDTNLELPWPNLKLTPRATAESHNAARLHHENLRQSPAEEEPLAQPQFGQIPSHKPIQGDSPFGGDVSDMLQFTTNALYDLTPSPSSSPPPSPGNPQLTPSLSSSLAPSPGNPLHPSTKITLPASISTKIVPAAKGHMPQATKDTIHDMFHKVNKIFHETAEVTGCSASQLVSLWNQTHVCTTNGKNEWISIRRILLITVKKRGLVMGIPQHQHFHKAFPDTWKDILDTHHEAEMVSTLTATVTQRARNFNKFTSKLTNLAESNAMLNVFETVISTVGNIINEDTGLGVVYMTPGAADCFVERLKIPNDTLIGHLKAHVYNNVSHDLVQEHLEEQKKDEQDDIVELVGGPMVTNMAQVKVPVTMMWRKRSRDEDTAIIRTTIYTSVKKVGRRITGIQLPWGLLLKLLASQGIYIGDWDERIPRPGEAKKSGKSSKSKGIGDLPITKIRLLRELCENPKTTPKFLLLPSRPRCLLDSKEPILIYAPPPTNSQHSHAKCTFLNGTSDRKGPARQLQSAAKTSVKRAKMATTSKHTKHSEEPEIISVHSHSPSLSPPHPTQHTHAMTQTGPSTFKAHYHTRKLTIIDSKSDDQPIIKKVTHHTVSPTNVSPTNSDSKDEGDEDVMDDDKWKEGKEGDIEVSKGAGVLKHKRESHCVRTKKMRIAEREGKGKEKELVEDAGRVPAAPKEGQALAQRFPPLLPHQLKQLPRPLPQPLLQPLQHTTAPKTSMNLFQEGAKNPQEGSGKCLPTDEPMLEATLKRSLDGEPTFIPGGGVSKKVHLNGPSSKGVVHSGTTSTLKEAAMLLPASEHLPQAMSSAQESHPSDATAMPPTSQFPLQTMSSTHAPVSSAVNSATDEPMPITSTIPILQEETPTSSIATVVPKVFSLEAPADAPPIRPPYKKEATEYEPPRWGPYPADAPLNAPPTHETEPVVADYETSRWGPYHAYLPHPPYVHPCYAYPPLGHPQNAAYRSGPYDNFWRAPPDRTLPWRYPDGEGGYQDGKGGGGDDRRQESIHNAGHYRPPAEGPAYRGDEGGDYEHKENVHDAGQAFYGPPRRQAEGPHGTLAYYDGYRYGFEAGPSREPSQPPPHDPYHPRFHQGPPSRHPSIPPPHLHAARRSPMPHHTPNPTSEQENLEGLADSGSGGTSL